MNLILYIIILNLLFKTYISVLYILEEINNTRVIRFYKKTIILNNLLS